MAVRRFHFDDVDWTKRDVEIARQVGCSRERVRQVRAAKGIKPTQTLRQRTDAQIRFLGGVRALRGLTRHEIGEVLGLNQWAVGALVRRLNLKPRKPPSPRVHHPELWNFDLPSADLAEIWMPWRRRGVVKVSQLRNELGKQPPRWTKRDPSAAQSPAYRRALQRERRRAAAFFQSSAKIPESLIRASPAQTR